MTTVRKAFTLLEILICFFLLTMIGGLVAFPVANGIAHHRYKNGLNKLKSKLEQIRVLSMSYQLPMHITLTCENGHVYYAFSTEEPLKTLSRKRVELPCVTHIGINGEKMDKVELTAVPSGVYLQREQIIFFRKQKNPYSLDLSQDSQVKIREIGHNTG